MDRERQKYCKEWRKRKRMVSTGAGPGKWQPLEKLRPKIMDLSGIAKYRPSAKGWFCFLSGN